MNKLEFYDTHAHLDDPRYDDDLEEVLARAKAAGVVRINLIGADLKSSERNIELAAQYPELSAVVGVHPHDAASFTKESVQTLEQWLKQAEELKIVAVGECGLDYYYEDRASDEEQASCFQAQLELAYTYDLPLVIHIRDAFADSLALIKEQYEQGRLRTVPGVVHCYSGSLEFAQLLLDLGFYLGFDGPVTFKNAKRPLEVASKIPLERLLIETDSPYLTPEPYRGKRNEPSYVVEVAKKIAEAREISLAELAKATTENARKLFQVE